PVIGAVGDSQRYRVDIERYALLRLTVLGDQQITRPVDVSEQFERDTEFPLGVLAPAEIADVVFRPGLGEPDRVQQQLLSGPDRIVLAGPLRRGRVVVEPELLLGEPHVETVR